jgi:hypothetical protein
MELNSNNLEKVMRETESTTGYQGPIGTFLDLVEFEGASSPWGEVAHEDSDRDGGYWYHVIKVDDRYFKITAPYHSEYGVDYDYPDILEVTPKQVTVTEWARKV